MPLRVLLVTQSYHPIYGGIGEHVRHLGLALRDLGHEVRVLTSGPGPEDGELPGLEVLRIGRRFRVPANGSSAAIALHPAYRRAVRRVVRDDPDVIHVHSPLEPLLPWAVLREARAPCVGTFHNAGPAPWGYSIFGRALAPLARRLAVRTAVSRSAAAYAGRHFPGEFLLIPNGVDIERFRPNGGRPPDRPTTVLFVGRLEPRKGLDVLIDGLALARERLGRDLRLIVVGDGSRRRRLLRGARRARIDLRMCGSLEPSAVPACYHDADLLVAPALYGESFGIVLLEALASGLPVVASRLEGFAEVLDRCPGARLFSPGDVGDLAERIVEVVRKPPSAAEARRHAVGYSWVKVAGMVEAAYLEAAQGPRAIGPRAIFTSKTTVY